jgi:hypothetical protein
MIARMRRIATRRVGLIGVTIAMIARKVCLLGVTIAMIARRVCFSV